MPSFTWLSSYSDEDLGVTCGVVLTDLAGNHYYLTPPPSPPLAITQAALDDFNLAVFNAAGGGKLLTEIKKQKRLALSKLMRQTGYYIAVTCNGDMAALLSSGFPIQKPVSTPVGPLPAPAVITLTNGVNPGDMIAVTAPIYGAGSFNWQIAAASAPTVMLQTAQTLGGRVTFSGLTPGVVYNVQVNAVGSAGTSAWSGVFSLMAV